MSAARLRSLAPRLRELLSPRDDAAADRDLLARFAVERDEAAFAELVRRHGPMVLRVCRRALPGGRDAEDVSQLVFFLIAQKAASLRWHDSVAGWLFQAARRLSLKARVAAARRTRHEAQARPLLTEDPAAGVTVRELQDALDDELSRLPEQFRAPVLLCCLEGRSRDEAAALLGWPLGRVKDRLERGRERLRQRLARRGLALGTALTSYWLLEGAASAALVPHAVARSALLLAGGQATLAGLLPAPVAALNQGVTTTMLLTRLTALAAALALALVAAPAPTRPADDAKPVTKKDAPPLPEAVPLTGHRGAVHAVSFAPDGKTLATAGADGSFRVWSMDGRQLQNLKQGGKGVSVAFSPDGKSLAAASGDKGGELVVWDAAGGKERWRSKLPAGPVAYSPDGRYLAVCYGVPVPAVDNATARSFDHANGRMVFSMHAQGGGTGLAYAGDGKTLAVADAKGNGYELQAKDGRTTMNWSRKLPLTCLAFLPDGRLVAIEAGRAALILNFYRGGKELLALDAKEPVRTLAVSADGKRIAAAGLGGVVTLWDSKGKHERRFDAGSAVHALAFSRDGKRLAAGLADGAVVWDLNRDETPLPANLRLSSKELESAWSDLASEDGGKAYAAARMLRADPARSVPFLAGRLAAKKDDEGAKRIAKLIADLDADEFETRETANKALEKLGDSVLTELRQALAAKPSPEAGRRLRALLTRLGDDPPLTNAQQRDVRAVRVLEQAGTPEARKALAGLAKASAGWWASREAAEAVGRMGK